MKNRILLFALLAVISIGSLCADGATVTLNLSQPTSPTTFEMASNRIWRQTYSNSYPYISFNNGVFSLTHLIDSDGFGSENEWGYWDGFTYSRDGDNANYGMGNSQSWVAHQFGNMAGGGIKTDAAGNILKDAQGKVLVDRDIPYLVAYWGYYKLMWGTSDKQPLQVKLDKTYKAVGVYVNNHPWPYYGNISGDGFARPFDRDGDFFKLTVHALDGNGRDNGKTVEHYFARNTGGVLSQSPDWEWVDLSTLGDIGGMYFSVESTDNDPVVGVNTAAYFCMDKLTVRTLDDTPPPPADIPVTGLSLNCMIAILKPGELLQLTAAVAPANATNKDVVWTSSNESVVVVTVNGQVVALSAGTATVSALTADGNYAATCAVTVSAATGTENVGASAAVYPGPFADHLTIETPVASDAALFALAGKTVWRGRLHAGSNCIDTSSLPAGVYILRYGRETVKLIKVNK